MVSVTDRRHYIQLTHYDYVFHQHDVIKIRWCFIKTKITKLWLKMTKKCFLMAWLNLSQSLKIWFDYPCDMCFTKKCPTKWWIHRSKKSISRYQWWLAVDDVSGVVLILIGRDTMNIYILCGYSNAIFELEQQSTHSCLILSTQKFKPKWFILFVFPLANVMLSQRKHIFKVESDRSQSCTSEISPNFCVKSKRMWVSALFRSDAMPSYRRE